MARVDDPLSACGARFIARDGGRLPLAVERRARRRCRIDYRLPVPSAQVKSAVLLAGLNAPGETSVIEPRADARPQRDACCAISAPRSQVDDAGGRPPHHPRRPARAQRRRSRRAGRSLLGRLPAGRRAAAAGLGRQRSRASGSTRCAPGSTTRLREMGADIDFEQRAHRRAASRSPICRVARARCSGVDVPAERAPAHDRRISDPRRRRRLRRGPHGDARPGRAAGQGERPARRHRRRASPPAASRSRSRATR